jgi:hypothetical protein
MCLHKKKSEHARAIMTPLLTIFIFEHIKLAVKYCKHNKYKNGDNNKRNTNRDACTTSQRDKGRRSTDQDQSKAIA